MTATVIVRMLVSDFATWFEEYERMHEVRETRGECGRELFRDSDEPNAVVVVFHWDSLTNARAYFASAELHASVERAQGKRAPHVLYLDRVQG
jgi:heme-degrading monooxygenase HmoA